MRRVLLVMALVLGSLFVSNTRADATSWVTLVSRNYVNTHHECGEPRPPANWTWWSVTGNTECENHFSLPWWNQEYVGPGYYRTCWDVKVLVEDADLYLFDSVLPLNGPSTTDYDTWFFDQSVGGVVTLCNVFGVTAEGGSNDPHGVIVNLMVMGEAGSPPISPGEVEIFTERIQRLQ